MRQRIQRQRKARLQAHRCPIANVVLATDVSQFGRQGGVLIVVGLQRGREPLGRFPLVLTAKAIFIRILNAARRRASKIEVRRQVDPQGRRFSQQDEPSAGIKAQRLLQIVGGEQHVVGRPASQIEFGAHA